jgi:hypothetical protein
MWGGGEDKTMGKNSGWVGEGRVLRVMIDIEGRLS